MDAKYEQRKKMIYDFMCDDMYVPMKIKELAIVLGVKKDQRPQLEQILNDLMMEGCIVCSKRGKFSKSERIWICQRGGGKGRYLYSGIRN